MISWPRSRGSPGGKYITTWQDSDTDGSLGSLHSTVSELTRTAVSNSANDLFTGDQLRDTFTGGAGNDTFAYKPGGNADVWTDFVSGAGSVDKIDVSALNVKFGGLLAHSTQSGNNTIIDFGGGDTLTLLNVSKTSLNYLARRKILKNTPIADATFDEVLAENKKLITFDISVASLSAGAQHLATLKSNVQNVVKAVEPLLKTANSAT